jgi:hypothetical protein
MRRRIDLLTKTIRVKGEITNTTGGCHLVGTQYAFSTTEFSTFSSIFKGPKNNMEWSKGPGGLRCVFSDFAKALYGVQWVVYEVLPHFLFSF